MSELDERAIVRLMEVAEERDLAFVQVRLGQSELTIARVAPSELAGVDLPVAARTTRPVEPRAPAEAGPQPGPEPPREGARAPDEEPTRASGAPPSGAEAKPPRGAAGDTIDAPMVGAFYRAPAPDQPPFVEIGSVVEIGDTVGLVEAMKVFTAVPATRAGVVREVLVENGSFVEFGQPLLRVEATPDGAGPGQARRG